MQLSKRWISPLHWQKLVQLCFLTVTQVVVSRSRNLSLQALLFWQWLVNFDHHHCAMYGIYVDSGCWSLCKCTHWCLSYTDPKCIILWHLIIIYTHRCYMYNYNYSMQSCGLPRDNNGYIPLWCMCVSFTFGATPTYHCRSASLNGLCLCCTSQTWLSLWCSPAWSFCSDSPAQVSHTGTLVDVCAELEWFWACT